MLKTSNNYFENFLTFRGIGKNEENAINTHEKREKIFLNI